MTTSPKTRAPRGRNRFANNELSQIDFQERVMAEGLNGENPLLERVRFLAIVASNLDEFFAVRVAQLKRQIESGGSGKSPDGRTPRQTLREIYKRIPTMYATMHRCMRDELLPSMEREGIRIVCPDELSEEDNRYLDRHFIDEVYPVLTPLAIGPGHPFPILGPELTLFIEISSRDEGAIRPADRAVLQLPGNLVRFVKLPGDGEQQRFVPMEEIIRPRLGTLFEGYDIMRVHFFRLTRDSEVEFDEDAEDLLSTIRMGLVRRRMATSVNLRVDDTMPEPMVTELCERLGVNAGDVIRIKGLLHMKHFFQLVGLPGFDHLRYEPLPPQPTPLLAPDDDIFEAVADHDILLHHPYETFDPVEEFVNRAADDEAVLAIKQTLYRTTTESPIMASLVRAAESGKQVTVLMELRARFDEENNIQWARKLEQAGAHVIYGLVGLKVHCKACLVIRREPGGIKRYCHLATGNYNEKTARLYTDLGLLSADEEMCQDISALFNVITGYSQQPHWNLIEIAPTGMRRKVLSLIEREIELSSDASPGHIQAKLNSLEDAEVIEALYRAGQAGVRIELVCRGLCCLLPGVPGLSDNIRVVSIVDRFLEHSRIFRFHNGGRDEVYLSSADWRPRNLDRRIELMFPVTDPVLAAEAVKAIEMGLADTVRGWEMDGKGNYARRSGKPALRSQYALYERAVDRVRRKPPRADLVFRPLEEPPHTRRRRS